MTLRRLRSALLALALAASLSASAPGGAQGSMLPSSPVPFTGELSVMTYNIHGVPWPVGWGRSAALSQIAGALRDFRAQGRNPHIVLLQEAFTDDARAIGREAGYRYVVDGPSAEMTSSERPTGVDLAFGSKGSWANGEGLGKYAGAGLQILSDFPIVGVRRMVYPAFACAGYDCLANKGALLASVALPDRPDPVDVITTHLNSRHASGVPDARSLYAYRRQVGYLTDFIHRAHDPNRALIVAGDFNVGREKTRMADLLEQVRTKWVQNDDIDDAYGEAARMGLRLSSDALLSRQRAKDWQFFTPGKSTDLELSGIDAPFGRARDGSMLSDHVGYTAIFGLSRRRPLAPTSVAPPRA